MSHGLDDRAVVEPGGARLRHLRVAELAPPHDDGAGQLEDGVGARVARRRLTRRGDLLVAVAIVAYYLLRLSAFLVIQRSYM